MFTAGSVLCGLAPSLIVLIAARVLQAVGAAMLQANSVALITEAMPRTLLGGSACRAPRGRWVWRSDRSSGGVAGARRLAIDLPREPAGRRDRARARLVSAATQPLAMYVLSAGAAIAVTVRRWETRGGSRQLVYEVALWGSPAGILGARLYSDITSWNLVPHTWWGPFAIWKTGLGIWGGIAAGTLVGLWRLRRAGAEIPAFMDAAAPGLLVAQAIGRIGNYFNQELFGKPTTLPWAIEISPAHRPERYLRYATFNPTFLYELTFELALAGVLIWLGKHRKIRHPGLFALYLAGYSGFRIFEELLRVDPSHRILGLRLNLYVASVLALAGLAWFARIQRAPASPSPSASSRSRGGADRRRRRDPPRRMWP